LFPSYSIKVLVMQMMPPRGGLPPSLTQAPPNAGPVTMQQGNQGNIAAALAKVQSGLKMFEEALPLIPMGSEEHRAVLDAIKGVSKHLKKGEENAQLEQAALVQQLKAAPNQAQQAAMARMLATQGQGEAPAMPQPQQS
jgi:hypothetical protein